MKEGSKADMALDKKQMMGMKKGGCTKMAKGGSVGSASKRADGVAVKGKTKGRNLGDSGKTVGIQSGARGMKRGGKC
jgi:hypothetical protein